MCRRCVFGMALAVVYDAKFECVLRSFITGAVPSAIGCNLQYKGPTFIERAPCHMCCRGFTVGHCDAGCCLFLPGLLLLLPACLFRGCSLRKTRMQYANRLLLLHTCTHIYALYVLFHTAYSIYSTLYSIQCTVYSIYKWARHTPTAFEKEKRCKI